MKKMFSAIVILFIASIISTSIIIILSPEIIPAHYNAAGEVDRYGSKYENLIFPALELLSILLYLLPFAYLRKKNAPKIEQQVLLSVCIFTQILFIILGLFFGIIGIKYSESTEAESTDFIYKFVNLCTGIILIVLGNLMPKARLNAMFGLRTKWSMSNDRVWQKSQRFGGFSAVCTGLLLVILSMILPGSWNFIVMTVVLAAWAALAVIASYRYWRADCIRAEQAPE